MTGATPLAQSTQLAQSALSTPSTPPPQLAQSTQQTSSLEQRIRSALWLVVLFSLLAFVPFLFVFWALFAPAAVAAQTEGVPHHSLGLFASVGCAVLVTFRGGPPTKKYNKNKKNGQSGDVARVRE